MKLYRKYRHKIRNACNKVIPKLQRRLHWKLTLFTVIYCILIIAAIAYGNLIYATYLFVFACIVIVIGTKFVNEKI